MRAVNRTIRRGLLACLLCATGAQAEFVPDDVLVSDPTSDLPDPEFDVVDNHFVWQDTDDNLWVARLNPVTGELWPMDGRGLLLDTNLRGIGLTGNGPEWGYGDGKPYIAYTRDVGASFRLGGAFQRKDFVWNFSLLGDSDGRSRPEGTAPSHRGSPRIAYNYTLETGEDAVGWRNLFDSASEGVVTGADLQAQGGRWVEGEDRFLVSLRPSTLELGTVDITQAPAQYEQITFTGGNKINPFAWWAPEYDEPFFSAMLLKRGRHQIGIFRRTSEDPNSWELFNTLEIPSENYPFVSSPEAFVANGRSYIVTVAASELGGEEFKFQPKGPSEIWIAGIDPDNPFYRRIDDPSIPFPDQPQRSEPEVYYTADGPIVFYTELLEDEFGEKIRLVRRAQTGLGTEYGYDNQSFASPWGTVNRDGRNSGETPFPIADHYEEAGIEAIANRQSLRGVMGPEGNLYYTMFRFEGGTPIPEFRGVDTRDGNAEVLTLTDTDISTGFIGTNALVDGEGNLYISGESRINKFTPSGELVWSVAVPGLPRSLQFAPDGRVMFFTWNGWFQTVDPQTGSAARQNLTPMRSYGDSSAECFSTGDISRCAYIDSPAVDPATDMIYVTFTTVGGNGRVEAWHYNRGTRQITRQWASAVYGGNVTSPVLSADYTRAYIQTSNGRLHALDTSSGERAWVVDLGYTTTTPKEPVVTEFGYIMPGGDVADSPELGYVGILRDVGDTFEWSFRGLRYAPLSQPAAGRGNRFALMAQRLSDSQPVMLVVNPFHGVISELPWTEGTLPTDYTGVTVREDGWMFVGTSGASTFKAYRPVWPQF
jgi:hypothetical protein